jgi:hypothetical protein
MPRLYAVGDRKSGVLFVKTEPFRAVMVDEQAIDKYAKTVGKDYDTVFGEIAGWATGFIASVDEKGSPDDSPAVPEAIAHRVSRGSALTDADFCFVANVSNDDAWDAKRNFVDIQPIALALDAIAPKPSMAFPHDLPHVDLESFVSRDMA